MDGYSSPREPIGAGASPILSRNPPCVSVIMPMHNVADYVGVAIRSVLDQTWSDLELIIVDDGSDDSSMQVAQAAIGSDDRVTVVTQPQQGQSSARNHGLTLARGNYLYFFDSDDLLDPDMLAICMQHIKADNLDFVAFSGTAFADGYIEAAPTDEFQKPDLPMPRSGQDMFVELTRQRAFSVSCCLYVFSSPLLDSIELRFDEGYLHEDEAFTAILYCASQRSIALSTPLFHRRIRPGSTMTKPPDLVNVDGCIRAAARIAEYLATSGHKLSLACRNALQHRQKTVLRQAVIFAISCRALPRLMQTLWKDLGYSQALSIDPLIAPFTFWYLVHHRLQSRP
jgi:glycosyltransferase involved in cell wall biosynthesis